MFDHVRKNPWVRAAAAFAALVFVVVLLWLIRPVLISLFFAFLVAYLLDPVVDRFERWRVRRTVTIAGLAAIGIAILAAIPLLFIPSLIQQADELITAAQAGLKDSGGVSGWVRSGIERLPLVALANATNCAEYEIADSADALTSLTACLSERIKAEALAFFQAHGGTIASAGANAGLNVGRFLASLGSSILAIVLFFGNVALFTFVAAYLLRDYDNIVVSARELLPLPYRNKISGIFHKIDMQVRGFVRGQLVVCMCLGVMYAIGLSIANVPFALLLGLFGAVASFIPYLGLALTIGPSLILVIVQHGGVDWHFFAVIATFIIAQMIEGTVLTPNIVGDKVGLSPVWVILAILIFGNAMGFLGLLLAVPIAASLKVLVVEALDYYKHSPAFNGPQPEPMPAPPPPQPAPPRPTAPPPARKKSRPKKRGK